MWYMKNWYWKMTNILLILTSNATIIRKASQPSQVKLTDPSSCECTNHFAKDEFSSYFYSKYWIVTF